MDALKLILTVVYLLVCVGIIVLVLRQDAKNNGLGGAIAGGANTYWSKNKGRSKQGILNKLTIILGAIFIILSVVLNFSVFQ